jgi:iron complex outermembrane receptor protein
MRSIKLPVFIALAYALAAGTAAQAQTQVQTAPDDTATQDDTAIVVSASRTTLPPSALPNTVEVINKPEFDMQSQIGGSAIDAVATLIPSFSPTRQKLASGGESLRGRNPLFLVDSVPQSTPLRDDNRDSFTLDPFFVDRVEVIFGSNAIQGIGATGGVINYVTISAPKHDGWSGAATAQISGDDSVGGDSMGYRSAARLGYRSGRFDVVVGGAYESRGAFYDGHDRRIATDETRGDLLDTHSWSAFGKIGYDLTDSSRIELMANHYELKGEQHYIAVAGSRADGLPATAIRGSNPGQPNSNNVDTASLSYRNDDLLGGVLNLQLFYNQYDGVFGGSIIAVYQDPRIAPSGTLFDQASNHSTKHGLRLSYERDVDFVPGFRVLTGVDLHSDKTYEDLILTDRMWVPPTKYESVAPFVQLHQALFDDRLNLSAGLRYEAGQLKVGDYTTLYSAGAVSVGGGEPRFTKALPNVGLTYKLFDGVTAYTSYAQGFTMADIGRVLRAINKTGQDVDDFLDLSPVISDNIEVGVDFNRGPLSGSVALFSSKSNQGALLVVTNGVYTVERQRTEISGVEASVRWQTPIDGLALSAGYANLKGRTDTDGDGKVDADLDGTNISPDRLNLGLDYRTGRWSFRLQNQTYFKRSFEGSDPRNAFEGYSLADLFVRRETGFGSVSLAVSNLFDKFYTSYSSDTSRPDDNLLYFAGRGRVVSLSVEAKL